MNVSFLHYKQGTYPPIKAWCQLLGKRLLAKRLPGSCTKCLYDHERGDVTDSLQTTCSRVMVAPQDKVLFYLFSFISLISLAPRSRCVGHLSLTDMIINIHNHLHNPNICCIFAVANVLRGKGSGGQCICQTYKPLQCSRWQTYK